MSEIGEPIPGLFVCANDMASIMRGHYPGPGITLGPALVFAYRAAVAMRVTELANENFARALAKGARTR